MFEFIVITLLFLAWLGCISLRLYLHTKWSPSALGPLSDLDKVDFVSSENMTKLEQFMQGRPHDKNKSVEEATMEYIQQVEEASMKRYEQLNK